MIRIICESCGAKFQVPDSVGGRTTHCTKCKAVIKIPAAAGDTGAFPAPETASPARPSAPVPQAPAKPAAPVAKPAPARPSAPAPAPAANSAADALAALSAAISTPARKPATPSASQPPAPAAPAPVQPAAPAPVEKPAAPAPRPAPAKPAPPAPVAPAPAPVAPVPAPAEVATRAYVVPDDLPQKSYDEEPAPKKSRVALFVTIGVIAAVVATAAICAPKIIAKFGGGGGSGGGSDGGSTLGGRDNQGQLDAIQADVTIAEEALVGVPESEKLSALDPVSLDEARRRLVLAKDKHAELIHKMQLMNMQGSKGKELLAKLQGSLEKIGQDLKIVDESYWPGPGTDKEMFERVWPSVPQIVIPDPGNRVPFLSSGTGFLAVSQGKWCVATNRHVITDAENGVKIIFRYGSLDKPTIYEIKAPPEAIARVHRSTDLAVIDLDEKDVAELKKNNIRPLPINPDPEKFPQAKPTQGDPCWLVGHPGGDTGGGEGIQVNAFNAGSVVRVEPDMPGFCECIQVDAAINPGNSGGPLFNKFGRVIGQVTFFRKDKDRQNYAVSVNILRGLVEPAVGQNWSWDKDEIQRILAPWKTLPEDYKLSAKSLIDQEGYVQVPLGTGVAKGVNTAVDRIPFSITDDKPYKLLVVTGKSSIFTMYITPDAPNAMPVVAPTQKDKTVGLFVDAPKQKGNYVLFLVNNYQNLKNPYIVALFKKK